MGQSGSGNGQFQNPDGIAVDSSNNVYVADYDNNRIEKFDSSGNVSDAMGQSWQRQRPVRIAPWYCGGQPQQCLCGGSVNNRVEKFDSNGNYLTQWGGLGSGNGQFIGPFGIAVDSGNNVYVADLNNNRIEKFSSNGNIPDTMGQ